MPDVFILHLWKRCDVSFPFLPLICSLPSSISHYLFSPFLYLALPLTSLSLPRTTSYLSFSTSSLPLLSFRLMRAWVYIWGMRTLCWMLEPYKVRTWRNRTERYAQIPEGDPRSIFFNVICIGVEVEIIVLITLCPSLLPLYLLLPSFLPSFPSPYFSFFSSISSTRALTRIQKYLYFIPVHFFWRRKRRSEKHGNQIVEITESVGIRRVGRYVRPDGCKTNKLVLFC